MWFPSFSFFYAFSAQTLYIKLEVGQTIKGDIEKIYLVCSPILGKKETSCKEIVWGDATQNYTDRRFLMEQQDGIRLEQFRQLKREVRSSDGYLIVGIDVSKDRHHACFRAASGRILLKRLVFENSYEGFERLLNQADVLRLENGLREVVFGMEPTGNYHKPLGEFLIRRLALVVLVSNVAAKENRKSLDGRWDKHDEKDAANVADLVSQGKFLFYEYPEPRVKELRVLLALKSVDYNIILPGV